MKNRKAQLAEVLVALYGHLSKLLNDIKDDEERAKFKNILNKIEKSALTELVSLTSML